MSNLKKWWKRVIYSESAQHDLTALILRIVFGGAMLWGHGWSKLTSFGERAATFSDPLGIGSELSLMLAVFAEFFCSFALMLGLATRLVLIPLIITMLVAAFVVHINQPFAKMEKAILFLAAFAVLFLTGPGKYSIGAAWVKNLSRNS